MKNGKYQTCLSLFETLKLRHINLFPNSAVCIAEEEGTHGYWWSGGASSSGNDLQREGRRAPEQPESKVQEGSSTSTLSGDDEEMRTGAVINIPGKASGTDSIICGYRGSTRAQMLPRGFIRIFTRPSPNLIFKPNIVRARRVKGLLTTRRKNLNWFR